MAMKVTFSNFVKYVGTPVDRYILPIIPVGSKLTEVSKITPAQLGKIPSRWNPNEKA
jgi:hypothetical protein